MSTSSRSIRVFVSSTFRDMQEDRDYLVKFVFPQLRRLCESRGVPWGEVDLRWGITEEEAAEGKVLSLCLEEIRLCRPYFIGLLGERYGWVPKPGDLPADLVERETWLKDHFHRSVTELEILHGVLRDPELHRRAFFYFRDPGYLDRLPEGRNRADFDSESPEAREKLHRLKQRIRAARDGDVCRLREDYRDPKQLGEWLLDDFTRLIDELYPEGEPPEDLDREASGHEAFARSRAAVYIGRQEYFDRLDAHVAGDGPPLVVLGESGSGKSALLANWFLDRFRSEVSESDPSATFALIHFIGSTADSADATQLMQRIMLELKRRFDLPGDVPAMPDEIREAFPQWLDSTAGAGRIVLAIDALNQLDDRDHALDLGWLPRVLPKNVRLFVSTLPGRSLDAVRCRAWPEMTVRPLTVPERKELIERFLAQFSRKLSPSHSEQIAESEQTANPLFLRAMLDELRQFGEHDLLGEMIDWYLAARNPQDLYQRILQRWEQDYGEGLVRRSLSLLWAARRGLSESELRDLLGTGQDPLPQAAWTPFFLAAEAALAQRSGLLQFFHDYLRNAVRERYFPTDDDRTICHRMLAGYFAGREAESDRTLEELPWQLQQAGEWAPLKDLLTRIDVFRQLRSTDRWKQDLQAYWLSLKAHYDPCEAYREALDRWEPDARRTGSFAASINELGMFHHERAEHEAAEALYRRALRSDEASFGPSHPTVAVRLNNLGVLLQATNRLEEAEPLFRRVLEIDEASYGLDHSKVAADLNNLAVLLRTTNRFAEAEPLLRRAVTIFESSFGPHHPDVVIALSNLAALLRATNRIPEAEPLYRRVVAVFGNSFGLEHPKVATALNNLAGLLQETNRLAEAEPLLRRALAIGEAAYGPDHPAVANRLNNLASLLQDTNRLAEAEPFYRRALAIDEAAYGPDHPTLATRLNNLGELLRVTNRLAEAEPPLRRALAIDEASYGPDHPDVARDLNNLALLYQTANRLAEAEPLHRRALAIYEASYGPDHSTVATSLNNLAVLLRTTNRLTEAEPINRRVVAILESSLGHDHPNVATALDNLATLLQDTNRLAEAEPLFRRALAIDEASYGPDHPEVARDLNNLAVLLRAADRLQEAEPLLRRVITVLESSLGPDHPNVATALSNLAALLRETNRMAEAEPLFLRALVIDEASYGDDHPTVAIRLNHLASMLQDANRNAEAEPLFRRSLAIDEASYGADHPQVATTLTNLASLLFATNRIAEAEPLFRRALAIDEASYGVDHPTIAADLNNLAVLLRTANRIKEAEPIRRRQVEIFLRLTAETGHQHPRLSSVLQSYVSMLQAMGRDDAEVEQQVNDLLGKYGMSLG